MRLIISFSEIDSLVREKYNLPFDVEIVVEGNDAKVSSVMNEIRYMVEHKQKIDAIKHLRSITGWGLKESKDAVEGNLDALQERLRGVVL